MTTPPVSRACPACHSQLALGARYCHRCGRALLGGGPAGRAPWIIAWGLVALSLTGISYVAYTKSTEPTRPDMANTGASRSTNDAGGGQGAGAPPDISQMSPRERFLRLNDRIMNAMEQGDTATGKRFAPMALTAYTMLDSLDPDVRYHAGAIHIRLGQYPEALALADTIQAEAKDHLFADLLRAETAQARGDRAGFARSRRAFLQHYDAQLATGRPEYQEHKAMLEDFRRQAQ
jgi:hypothetical protein